MTIKTLELKQKQFLLEHLLGAKRSSKHRTREALNPKTSSPSQGWHCWIKIGCRRVPRTNSSRTYPHQTPALDCANSIKLRLNMSGWIKWNFGKTMWVAMRQPVTHRAVWNHSVLELGGFLFNDFSRAEWRINKIYYTRLFEVALSLEYWAWTWTLDESIWISRLIHAHTHHMQIQTYVSLSCTHIPVPACSQTFLRVLVSATELLGETCGGWFQLYNIRAQPDQFLHIQSKHAFVINDFHKTGAICAEHTWIGMVRTPVARM